MRSVSTISFAVLFIVGTVLAIYCFVSNLSNIAQAHVLSMDYLDIEPEQIGLDKNQQTMIDLAAKYMLLYLISISCTVFALLLTYFVLGGGLRPSCFMFTSCCVSVLC